MTDRRDIQIAEFIRAMRGEFTPDGLYEFERTLVALGGGTFVANWFNDDRASDRS